MKQVTCPATPVFRFFSEQPSLEDLTVWSSYNVKPLDFSLCKSVLGIGLSTVESKKGTTFDGKLTVIHTENLTKTHFSVSFMSVACPGMAPVKCFVSFVFRQIQR